MYLPKLTLPTVLPWLLSIGGAWGLFASFVLSYDTIKISQNSHYIPACNLNPVLSCGDVISTAGDKIFGLPYPFYGIAAFAVLLTVGIVLLTRVAFTRWFWLVFEVATIIGLLAAYAMLFKSVYKIHALCPYCLSIDIVTTIIWWYVTLYIFDRKYIKLSSKKYQKIYQIIREHHLDIIVLWFIVVIGLILKHFWYYYGKHL